MDYRIVYDLLSDYFRILLENHNPEYIQSKHKEVVFDKNDSTEILWNKHNKAIQNNKLKEKIPKCSLLDLKIEIADRIFKNCVFCENRCHVNREKNMGLCKVKKPRVASEFLHMGEETPLVPSHTIFFSGCTFKCVFCQNYDISQKQTGLIIKPSVMADIIRQRQKHGCKNVNWVGGDPTPNLLFILKTLRETNANLPQIWNSNMYCSKETMQLLNGVIDLYLTDFKYGNDECAKRLSKIKNYTQVVKRNHKTSYDTAEVLIRHLVMPEHVECCSKPIMEWISKNLPNALVNIMGQYHPEYQAYTYEDISRNVSSEEVSIVKKYAKNKNINVL
jgi:putative pyruvate formate lyase activating enzyme